MKFTPTVGFVPDAVPETARQIDELLAQARSATPGWPSRRRAPRYAAMPNPTSVTRTTTTA